VSHLLYFRVEQALPLAEHAMSCPTHRLTPEQVAAGARLRPALVLTATADGIGLSSNGVPSWCDDAGDLHTAPAWTWHHPGSGRRGTDTAATDLALTDTAATDLHLDSARAARPTQAADAEDLANVVAIHAAANDAGRFLSLTRRYRDRRDPLITVLRRGARRGGHWLVLDTDPTHRHSRGRFQVVDHRDDLLPASTTWTATTVTAPQVWYHRYPALVADGYTVHGGDGLIARFDHSTVAQMSADLAGMHIQADSMPGEVAALRRIDDDPAAVGVAFSRDDGVTERWVEVDRVYPDAQGFYAIGTYLWPWTE
jgi:hypothetical protein